MKKTLTILVILVFSFLQIFAEDYITHTLKKGETVWRISKNYGVSL